MLSARLIEISEKVESVFGGLNAIQLNWKPSPTQWSVAQCIRHLIVSNKQYMPSLNKIISGQYKMNFWEKYNPMSKYTGKKMVESLGIVVKRRFKAPLIFSPGDLYISEDVVSEFISMQNNLTGIYIKLENGKYENLIVTSPVAPLITLPLSDLMEILVVHEERHLKQAMKVKDSPAFPI